LAELLSAAVSIMPIGCW